MLGRLLLKYTATALFCIVLRICVGRTGHLIEPPEISPATTSEEDKFLYTGLWNQYHGDELPKNSYLRVMPTGSSARFASFICLSV